MIFFTSLLALVSALTLGLVFGPQTNIGTSGSIIGIFAGLMAITVPLSVIAEQLKK